jgi:sulfur carrier protein
MKLYINGAQHDAVKNNIISALLEELGLGSKADSIVIEVNETIIKKTDWASHAVTDGDRIEIISFVGGG